MVIKLTKDYTKPSGKVVAKGTRIEVVDGHPYKDFEILIEDGSMDTPKNKLQAEEIIGDEAKELEEKAVKQKTDKNK